MRNRCYPLLSILLFFSATATAQIDLQCDGRDQHSIYLTNDTAIFRIDSVDTNPTDPIYVNTTYLGEAGISINNRLDSTAAGLTIYLAPALYNYYWYWDGNAWINTGFSPGATDAINPGGTANTIFNLNGNSGQIYLFNGHMDGYAVLSNLSTYGCAIYDIAIDSTGNFYLFFTTQQRIDAYNSNAQFLGSFTTTGFPYGTQPGFTIVGDKMYAIGNAPLALYQGIVSGNTVSFTAIKSFNMSFSDIASCPNAGKPIVTNLPKLQAQSAIYPNPTTGQVFIKTDKMRPETVEVYDITGERVIKQPYTGEMDLGVLNAGIYFIELKEKSNTLRSKVVKVN